ncbi:GIY-YIG nuclease family protein [Veillonella ratti]|uniref:GIY-YIG nuclease family protein n=1 Tax=Veillonella ratti TaxID=103892 RepID=UPI000F8CF031|nr:GIY-YIG nuclease family protein [Veillonella ratti]
MHDDLSDILSDDSLFENLDMDNRLFSNKRYKRTVAAKIKSSQRKKMGPEFDKFKKIFSQVRVDLSEGRREIKAFDNITSGNKISKRNPIKQGNFYIDNGIMLYIDKIYDTESGKPKLVSTNRNDRVCAIFENGTKNDMKLLSLISSLYDKKRNGRFITAKSDEILNENSLSITTGYIYVVKYAGNDTRFLKMPNLYKIGFAKNIKQRLANSINEATYLFAPVTLVCAFEIQNVDARKVENYMHHMLASNRLDLSLIAPNGKNVTVKEWFIINLEEIHSIINEMIVKLQIG